MHFVVVVVPLSVLLSLSHTLIGDDANTILFMPNILTQIMHMLATFAPF
jgi:hypothetical protein